MYGVVSVESDGVSSKLKPHPLQSIINIFASIISLVHAVPLVPVAGMYGTEKPHLLLLLLTCSQA